MELPSMNAVTPFICSRGSPFLGQKMSDLKIDRIEVRISHRFWSPGEWITRILSLETWVIFNVNVEASLNGRVFFLIFLQDFIFATLQLWDISIKIMSNLMSVSQQNMSFNYECPNVPILHYFWRGSDLPPSVVSVMSWARNCPNCIAMWVKPFEPAVTPPSVLCISFDTFLALTSTWTRFYQTPTLIWHFGRLDQKLIFHCWPKKVQSSLFRKK